MKTAVSLVFVITSMAVSDGRSATPVSEQARHARDAANKRAYVESVLQGAREATLRASQELKARYDSPEPLPKLRLVDGQLYDVEKSQLWFDLADLTVAGTNEAGATVERDVPTFTLPGNNPVDVASIWMYRGKVLSVTDTGCLVSGWFSTDLLRPAKDESTLFFVSGLTGKVDDDAVIGYAVVDGTYEYSAVSGAKKTVRSFILATRGVAKERFQVRNLRRPAGTTLLSLRVLKIGEGVYDCGVASTVENRKAATNQVKAATVVTK